MADTRTLNGSTIRNRFSTKSGKPKCAHRVSPYCEHAATIVVGLFGYCKSHSDDAKAEYATYLATKRADRLAMNADRFPDGVSTEPFARRLMRDLGVG